MFFIFCLFSILFKAEAHALPTDSLYLQIKQSKYHNASLRAEELISIYQEVQSHMFYTYSAKGPKTLFYPLPFDLLPDTLHIQLSSNFIDYCNPFQGIISSGFGWRDGRMHKGIDIDLNKGDPVKAVADGTVRFAGRCGGWGLVVVVDHGQGIETLYAHLSKITVKIGQIVLSEQCLGKGGNSGRSRGSHLHFELRWLGHAINPLHLIQFSNSMLYNNHIVFIKGKNQCYLFPKNARICLTRIGDSWKKLAMKNGKKIMELYTLNGIYSPSRMRPGAWVRVE